MEMAMDVTGLQSFSDADLLKLYRWGLAQGAAGQTRSISGRTVSFPSVKDMREMIDWLEERVARNGDTDGGTALGEFL